MNNMRQVARAFSTTSRARSVSLKQAIGENKGIIPDNARYMKIVERQKKYANHDGLLVWQKEGAKDKMGFLFTSALTAASTLYAISIIWKMSWPAKKE